MLMMRSTGTTKMGKPPPPVPPRPSKSVVAEALAQRRKGTAKNEEILSSKSCLSGNQREISMKYERNISEELHCNNSRPIVYQSANLKRKESDNRRIVEVKQEEDVKNVVETITAVVENNKNCCNDMVSNKMWDNMLNDRNHVNTLIDEMFASVLNVPSGGVQQQHEEKNIDEITTTITINNNAVMDLKSDNNGGLDENMATVIIIKDDGGEEVERNVKEECKSDESTTDRKKVQFDDQMNHELLISELQNMKMDQEKILKRQRKPSMNIYENSDCSSDVVTLSNNIQCNDWVEMNGDKEINLSTCQITIEGLENGIVNRNAAIDCKRINKMSSLHGLPPLPKSLSGFNLLESGQENPPTPIRTSSMRSGSNSGHLVYPPHPKSVNGTTTTTAGPVQVENQLSGGRKSTNLDTQLAILRREMYSLRQLDLSLLSQLWSLNESIQDFRQILQDQDDRVLSPPSPSPVPSSCDEGDGDEFYMSTSSISFRPAPPPPPIRRPSSSSNASSIHEER